MAPRGFDRYMVAIGMGTHPKLARLTDAEFRAHVVGVLAVAAMAPVRGRLLVGHLPAEPIDIARIAGVPEKAAASTIRKLMAIGVLQPDEEYDCLRVHDWEDINPPPKTDASNAERQRRFRARNGESNGESNGGVTDVVTPPEVEGEVEVEEQPNTTVPSLRADTSECFAYWQERCDHKQAKLTSDRRRRIEARLREGYTVHDIRKAIDGAARSPFVNDAGHRFDDLELICRSGSKLEDFMARTDAKPPLRVVSPLHTSREMSPEAQARIDRRLAQLQADEEAS